ncbi:hypothetical protein SEA_WOLLYPOG_84 [Arthrobacter phage Wollypog]|uniref:Uncharacterized protein n=1 Tax=Arthrobacter phage Wollypog TaxID=2790985 RepID=A0A7T3KCC1_9CAUD|nr:hypothetical protein PP291_gp84 [Arthrobacter phage Wollypog]QPX62633.1 hypothetical protein SEA_WOLLYPOG_84 [Arthrobacter phage Wollypog]
MADHGWHYQPASAQHMGELTPCTDIVEHTRQLCICKPKFKFETGGDGMVYGVIVHDAADGRPAVEVG